MTNTGNVTLKDVTLADTVGGVTISGGPIASMAPGAVDSSTFTGTYTLTQADIDAGTKHNLATVTGTAPDGSKVTAESPADVPLEAKPSIASVKTGKFVDGNGDGIP